MDRRPVAIYFLTAKDELNFWPKNQQKSRFLANFSQNGLGNL
jgi:hypothetical protein